MLRGAGVGAMRHGFGASRTAFHSPQAWRVHSWVARATVGVPHTDEVVSPDQVPLPLSKRPAAYTERLQELLSWLTDVMERIDALGDAFETADGGPGAALLRREVTWALDDAVAAYREAPESAWCPCSWQQLEQEVRVAQRRSGRGADGGSSGAWQVQLRAPVGELRALWKRRIEDRVPFQYLIHSAHWREFVLSVGPGVLVPRPETEQMIDMAAAALDATPALADAPWADLGTGSGALAVGLATLLHQRRRRRQQQAVASSSSSNNSNSTGSPGEPAVWAVDVSPAARAYAAANAAACAPPGSVCVAAGSWWDPLAPLTGRLGGVLTNPPYIPRVEMGGLQREVGAHEPHGALDGGAGPGLDSLEVICAGAGDMLVDGGYIAIETAGGEQAERVRRLLEATGAFERAAIVNDCFGVGRFVEAWRRPRAGSSGGL